MSDCRICPRDCKVDRSIQAGYCGVTDKLKVARAGLHHWEEPCFSGNSGSGTVFFSGCSMHCVFCQNQQIANGLAGKEISILRLSQIYLELQQQGAHNINLVTAGHYIPQVRESLLLAKEMGLSIPVLYNSSGYESVDSLKLLEGLVDIYLPDFKYWKKETAACYSNAPDYPSVAKAAIAEMVRQVGAAVFDSCQSIRGKQPVTECQEAILMKRGVLVRHLILPGYIEESKEIVRYLVETYGDDIYVSIMNQYTPMAGIAQAGYPELDRKVTEAEYDEVVDYAIEIGLENGFIQEGETAEESFIPAFDGFGV